VDQAMFDLLSSDVKIVDSTVRTEGGRQGTHTLRFPGQFMPDGQDFLGEVPEKLDPSILKEWCNAVRREYDARNNRKEAEARDARKPDGEGGSGHGVSTQPGTGAAATPGAGEASEASMESYLEAEVAKWNGRKCQLLEELDGLDAKRAGILSLVNEAERYLMMATKVRQYHSSVKEANGDLDL